MIQMNLPARLEHRESALRLVHSALREVGGTGDFHHAVISAFSEAFNNIAMHAYAAGAGGNLEAEIEVGEESVTIRLRDWGVSFNLDHVIEPDLDALPESGMGLFIIRSFMDEVTYQPGTPNVLSMTKHFIPPAGGADRAR
jgi:serine/threonine-protein kinase RsbW